MASRSGIRIARSEPRFNRAIKVRVFGLDANGHPFHLQTTTVDISARGARLKGLRCWNAPGETVGMRCGAEKARFRVMWVGKPGTPQADEVGLYCVEPGKFLWTGLGPDSVFDLIDQVEIGHIKMPIGRNRRLTPRVRVSGRVQVRESGSSRWYWAVLCDLSRAGCYLEMPAPLAAGISVEANVNVSGTQLNLNGQVITCHPVGMGIRFHNLSLADQQRLEKVLAICSHSRLSR